MDCVSNSVSLLLLITPLYLVHAEAQQTCSASGAMSMLHSQGFITAAMSAMSPLGVGKCIEGTCNVSLAACRNSTCCLPNFGGNVNSSYGCQRTNDLGNVTCIDPKLLNIDVFNCDSVSGPRQKPSMQIYASKRDTSTSCVSKSSVELVRTEESKANIEVSVKACSTESPVSGNS